MILIRKIYNGDNFAKIELKVLFQSSSRAGGWDEIRAWFRD